jgi:hypothetical protein
VLQQTPSAQNPFVHSPGEVHAAPFASSGVPEDELLEVVVEDDVLAEVDELVDVDELLVEDDVLAEVEADELLAEADVLAEDDVLAAVDVADALLAVDELVALVEVDVLADSDAVDAPPEVAVVVPAPPVPVTWKSPKTSVQLVKPSPSPATTVHAARRAMRSREARSAGSADPSCKFTQRLSGCQARPHQAYPTHRRAGWSKIAGPWSSDPKSTARRRFARSSAGAVRRSRG